MTHNDEGFTLIELLVVILIIGVLAAIALPVFVGQQKKGHDADAKSLARNLVTQIEGCVTATQDYAECGDAELAAQGVAGPFGTAAGQITVSAATETTWTIRATSRAESDGVRHVFQMRRVSSGDVERTCVPAGQGACPASQSW